MSLYPKAKAEKTYTDLPEDCATRIITKLEAGETKAQMLAYCLNGSNNVPAFNVLYDEIVAEAKAMRAVDPCACKDDADYLAKLADVEKHLSAATWRQRKLEAESVDSVAKLKPIDGIAKEA